MTMHDVLRTSPYDGEAEQRESRIATQEEKNRVEKLRTKLRRLDAPEIQTKTGQYYQDAPFPMTSPDEIRSFVVDYGYSPRREGSPRGAKILTLGSGIAAEFSLHFGEGPDDPARVTRVIKREGEAPSCDERDAQPEDFEVINHALKKLERQEAEAA